MMNQRETTLTCRTCGTKNSVYEPYCTVCQSVLEGTTPLQAINKESNSPVFFKQIPRLPVISRKKKWLIIPIIFIVPVLLIALIFYLFSPVHSAQPDHAT